MSKKILVIQNPVSGAIQNKFNFEIMMGKLRKKKYKLTIKTTTSTEGADEILRKEKELYDLIFVCGGDGTLNQVVTEFSNNEKIKKPIIYMPLGTTNDFGKSLKIRKDKSIVIEDSEKYFKKKCDTGIVNKKQFFNYIAAAGLFTKSSYKTNRMAKRIFGRLAYIVNGAKELFHIKEYEATVYVNDKIIEDKFIYMSISNSYSIGGFKIFKESELELNDGKFEILLIKKPKNLYKLAKLGIKLLSKNHEDEDVIFLQSKEAKIKTKEKINWTFDGEDSGKYEEINISNINKNIEFIIY